MRKGNEDGDVDEDNHDGDGSHASTPAPSEDMGRESSPLCTLLHGLSLNGERFSPLVLGCRASQRGESPSEIGSISLRFSRVFATILSPFIIS